METQNSDLMNKVVDCRRKVKVESETVAIFDDQITKLVKKIKSAEEELELAKSFKAKSENKVSSTLLLKQISNPDFRQFWLFVKNMFIT